MLCPICAGEFQMRLASCPGCGCGLVPSQVVESRHTAPDQPKRKRVEMVELCRPRAFPVAMLIKQMLEQNGIAATVQGGQSLSLLPHLAFGGELRVFVASDQLDYARALYNAYFESDGEIDFLPEEEH
ncbi:MAG TPA: hypothetical protein VKA70_13485 [Blastocatellia bacterium]|nr:hypothetical protein [Blastocatellia bacterium]